MSMSKRMTVRFSDTDLIRLRSYADANGLDVAKAIREVVTTFLTMVETKAVGQVSPVGQSSLCETS